MIRLLGLDLDGTVFDDQKNISAQTKEAIRNAMEAGVTVVPITGRPFCAVTKNVFEAADFAYLASTSGAVITDLRTKQKIHEDLIKNRRASAVLESLKKAGLLTMAFIDGQGFVEKENFERALAYAESEVVRNYIRTTRTAVDHLPEYIQRDGRDVEKFTVSLPHDKDGGLLGIDYALDALSDCRDDMDIVYGGAINIEVTNKTATKGNVLRFLGKMLGISKEETMACGDSGNDREMLEAAGIAVAMENAEESVKKAASFITKSNEEDGVAYAIRKFIL
ncbi:MAG TPA: Cof-type HAD-IIB family hydrolase [Lachnospiraceae bacterium]|nr:Cof-type HAD-IIB family hydrolase [Lachnospiraceae bacterium]